MTGCRGGVGTVRVLGEVALGGGCAGAVTCSSLPMGASLWLRRGGWQGCRLRGECS